MAGGRGVAALQTASVQMLPVLGICLTHSREGSPRAGDRDWKSKVYVALRLMHRESLPGASTL